MLPFYLLKIISLLFFAVPFDIVAIIVIAKDGELTVRRLQLPEPIDIRLYLPGRIVYQVTGENKQIALLLFNKIEPPLHSRRIVKTPGMNIGDLRDRKPVKSCGQIVKIKSRLMYLIIILPFQHGIHKTRKRYR